MRLVDALLPERLGRDFRWLWSSFAATNLADGILLAAGPLLVASVTREPFAIAMAVFAQRVPWLLLGVVAGAIIDRTDRRRLIATVNALRAVVLALLAAAIATGSLSLPLIYVVMFLIGVAETFADNAGSTLVAVTVPSAGLGQANARLMGTLMVTNQLGGPPIGAFLFGVGYAVPFGVNALWLALAVALVLRIQPPEEELAPQRTSKLRGEIVEGVRWLWAHPAVRTLALLITVFNITFGAAFSIWVLYALERLGLDEVGFGLLLTASAVGGVAGSVVFGRLERRFSYSTLLRTGLTIESGTHLGLALTTSPLVAGAVMTLFGVHAVVWGSISSTIRQRAVPSKLLGRVTSVYMIGSVGAFALGTLLGGVIAQQWEWWRRSGSRSPARRSRRPSSGGRSTTSRTPEASPRSSLSRARKGPHRYRHGSTRLRFPPAAGGCHMTAVETDALRRVFRSGRRRRVSEVVALDGISLQIPTGEVHGILGPNGAGKTTLVKILSTVLLPTSGTARVLGRDVVAETQAVRERIGLVFGGERGLYTRLTARENLVYAGILQRLDDRRSKRRAEELLERVGLAERADDRVEGFSRGMKQRLHLARGLVGDPEVLFLDEPTTGLDPVAGRAFRDLIRELNDEGRTILLTTHDMVEAESVCERVTLIDRGQIIATESPRTLGTLISRYERVDVEGASEEALAHVRTLRGVSRVSHLDHGVARIETNEAGVTAAVLEHLVRSGVTSLRTSLPNLEEVYLHRFGRRGLEV